MATQTLDDQIRQAEDHILAGDYGDALTLLHEVLSEDPTHTEALNDAAVAYKEMGDILEAVKCLEAVLQQDPTHSNAFFNLLDTLALTDDLELVIDAYLRYEEQIPDTEEKVQYAERITSAANAALPVPQTDDNTEGYDDAPHQKDTDVLKVAIVCNWDQKFIKDIERELGKRHRVRTAYFDAEVNLQQIQQVMDWADVTWFEWCNEILVHASQKLRKTSAVICRLHSYEALGDLPNKVNWEFVDRLVLVAEHMKSIFKNRFPAIVARVALDVIPNGVDLEHFPFQHREPGHNLAYVGYLNHKKNLPLVLQCLHALVLEDERYHLHVAGVHQQPRYEIYWDHMLDQLELRQHVTMHGWVEDISTWLEDKHFLVSASVHESFGYGIAEAMARGIKPVIHNFKGADEIFPKDLVFGTIPEFVTIVQSPQYESWDYRQHIEKNYALSSQVKSIAKIVERTVGENAPDKIYSSSGADEVILPNNIKMLIPNHDHISNILKRGMFYEHNMLKFIEFNYTSDFNFVDIGAHIGNHTIYISNLENVNHVFSFEPNLNIFKYLEYNIQLNSIENVTLQNIALGDRSGFGSLTPGPAGNTGMASINADGIGDISISTLDDTISDPIHIIKLDVEGMAGSVLRGGLHTITRYTPDLYIECSCFDEYEDVKNVLEPLGYLPRRRFNHTPTILFEHLEQNEGNFMSYEAACAL